MSRCCWWRQLPICGVCDLVAVSLWLASGAVPQPEPAPTAPVFHQARLLMATLLWGLVCCWHRSWWALCRDSVDLGAHHRCSGCRMPWGPSRRGCYDGLASAFTVIGLSCPWALGEGPRCWSMPLDRGAAGGGLAAAAPLALLALVKPWWLRKQRLAGRARPWLWLRR